MMLQCKRSSVSWNCIAREFLRPRKFLGSAHVSSKIYRKPTFRRWVTAQTSTPNAFPYANADIATTSNDNVQISAEDKSDDNVPIRERLKRWSEENQYIAAAAAATSSIPPDAFIDGSLANTISRTQSTGSSDLDQIRTTHIEGGGGSKGEPENTDSETSIVGLDSRTPGDLVELRAIGSRVPVFSVYLGYFGDRNHFYAANGKWITSMGFSALFTVSNFATEEELKPLLAKIPRNATPEQFDELRQEDMGPSREDGIPLINKMTEFRLSSEAIYQRHMTRLDAARSLLASSRAVKYLSLFEMADILLPENLKSDQGFSPPALYAVHTTLSRDDTGFRPLSPSADSHRRDHIFEISPLRHTEICDKIAAWVREYTDFSVKKSRRLDPRELKEVVLDKFIRQAREVVLKSRQVREWTPHGILKSGPSVTLPKVDWSPVSKDVITFLEWWASYNLFDDGSRYHAHGALILRSLRLYDDTLLDQSAAWTFLQEIGVISPWEIPSRYKVRFPGTTVERGGGIMRAKPRNLQPSLRSDIAVGARRFREGSTTFCIDAPSTTIIDDGISLGRTERPDEFWIHIHVADPASAIQPNSELGKFMELIPDNIYLPGHFQAMLPSDLGEESANDYRSEILVKNHSLHSGAPALTFSAKVKENGDILDYKVEASTLQDVIYLDPEDVSEFCGEETPPIPTTDPYSFHVGIPPDTASSEPERAMTSARALDDSSQNDLLTLDRLAKTLKQRRLEKGAWPYFFPRPSVQVSFHQAIPEVGEAKGVKTFPPDPYIEVGRESSSGCSVVSNTMVLAGQIAARWCSSRGIPIPYRKDAKSVENFDQAFDYVTNEVYPLIRQGIEPSASHRQELSRLTGGIQLSTQPGPYFLLGLEMYAKATSPLRRFGDLLVHWQIHAALAHERRTGRPIDPSVDKVDEILPFTTASLEETLPLLQMRERMATAVSGGNLDWILIALVRAWRFEEKAPRTLRFTVSSRWRQGLLGKLDMYDLKAALDTNGLNGCRLMRDIQVGDEFEVELADVNVHSRRILVKALRYLGKPPSS